MAWFTRSKSDSNDTRETRDTEGVDDERPGGSSAADGDPDVPEYDAEVVLRPRIHPTTADDQRRIAEGLAALTEEGVDVDDLLSIGAAFDAALRTWHDASRRRREDDAVVSERYAVGIGEHLARHTDLGWARVRDAFGTDLAVAGGRDDFVVVPFNLVTSRWLNGESGWVPGVVGHLVRVRASR